MKKLVIFAMVLAFIFVSLPVIAVENFAPGIPHTGYIGAKNNGAISPWQKAYVDYLYLYGTGKTYYYTFTGTPTANRTITLPNASGTLVTEERAVSSHAITAAEAWVLSATEAHSLLLIVTSGNGATNIIAPSITGKQYYLRNASTAGAVTLKASGLTGVAVACGKTAILMNSGGDYVRITADATH